MGDITKISRANDLRNIGDAKARADIADNFDATKNYSIGDVVLYDGLLYRFTSVHAAGAWNSSHVTASTSTPMFKKLYDGNPSANTNITLQNGEKFSDYVMLFMIGGGSGNHFDVSIPVDAFKSDTWNWWVFDLTNDIWKSVFNYVSDTQFKFTTKGSYISNVKIYGLKI